MTLNDPEWLEWPFYVKFSLLRTDFESYYLGYLFTVESIYIHVRDLRYCFGYTRVTSEDVRKRVADCDPQNVWNPRKNCGSFVDDTLSEI